MPGPDVPGVRLEIAAALENVPALGGAVREVCTAEGMSELDASMIELGIVEAVTNVIEHAYGGRPGGTVTLAFDVSDSEVHAVINDRGARPDPLQIAERPLPDPSGMDREALSEGGRGLAIMRGIFDDVSFASDGDQNTVSLTRHLRRPT